MKDPARVGAGSFLKSYNLLFIVVTNYDTLRL